MTAQLKEAPAGIGHNRPSPFEEARDRVELYYGEAQLWLDGQAIETQEQADELSNLVERLAVLNPGGLVRVQDLPQRYREHLEDRAPAATDPASGIQANAPAAPADGTAEAVEAPAGIALPDDGLDLRDHMAQIELRLIREALERTDGVVAHAAQLLGLRRTTLAEKLRKYGIEREPAPAQ